MGASPGALWKVPSGSVMPGVVHGVAHVEAGFQVLPLWLLWLPLPAAALSGVLFASGIGNGLVNPSLHTIMTLRIPEPLRPTVMTTKMVIWALFNPLGLVVAGPVLDTFGTTPVLVGFALTQTLSMSAAAFVAVRERIRQRPPARLLSPSAP